MVDYAGNVRPSIREETERRVWCKHFNGLENERCTLDIVYDTVRVARHDGPFMYRYACFRADAVSDLCRHVLYPSAAEIEQDAQETELVVQEAHRWMTAALAKIKAGICPHCQQPMTQVQRGWEHLCLAMRPSAGDRTPRRDTTRAAMASLTRAVAREVDTQGITVTAVVPRYIPTAGNGHAPETRARVAPGTRYCKFGGERTTMGSMRRSAM